MTTEDKEYFYKRAEVELQRAADAHCPQAVKAHYTLAGHYLDRVYGRASRDGVPLHAN